MSTPQVSYIPGQQEVGFESYFPQVCPGEFHTATRCLYGALALLSRFLPRPRGKQSGLNYTHFTDEDTQAQKSQETFPRTRNWGVRSKRVVAFDLTPYLLPCGQGWQGTFLPMGIPSLADPLWVKWAGKP